MSKLDRMLEPEVTAVHRLEVINGTGRRRRFASDYKARIVEETFVPGAVVSDVARRHGLTPQQVFTWRRQARQPLASTASQALQFVPPLWRRHCHQQCCEDGSASGLAKPAEALAASRLRSMA